MKITPMSDAEIISSDTGPTCIELINNVAPGLPKEAETDKVPEIVQKAIIVDNAEDLDVKTLRRPAQIDRLQETKVAKSAYYNPPDWALVCPETSSYALEVIKNGTVLPQDMVHLSRFNHCIIGRQPLNSLNPNAEAGTCSIMLHPSISRSHAVLQYGIGPNEQTPGWFVYDLGSTHGTYVNKHRAPPRRFLRLHVGYVLRFGSSTRLLVLQGPEDDVLPESKESWSELVIAHTKRQCEKEERLAKMEEDDTGCREQRRMQPTSTDQELADIRPDNECTWGLLEDANVEDENEDLLHRLADSSTCLNHEKIYAEDAKKALKAYFDREGIDPPPQYDFVEGQFGQQICQIELPLESGTVYAEVPVTGRKRKEAIAACALEACRLLDRLGEFDGNKDGAAAVRCARRREKLESNDYYSSDEDIFFDRTGQIEVRRKKRMRKLGVETVDAEGENTNGDMSEDIQSEDSLSMLAILEKLGKEIIEVEEELDSADRAMEPNCQNASEMDELEAYMAAIKSGVPNRAARQSLKQRLFALRQRETRLLRKLGIRGGTGRFCSSSSSAAATAVRAALASNDAVTEAAAKVGSRNESKLNNIKRQLKTSMHSHHSSCKVVAEKVDFIPEVEDDRDEEEAGIRSTPPVSTKITSVDEESPTPLVDGQCSDSDPPKDDASTAEALDPTSPLTSGESTETPAVVVNAVNHEEVPGNDSENYNTNDPNYDLWIPPQDQSGDGMTELNKKYGY